MTNLNMFVILGTFVTMVDDDLFLKITDKDGHEFDLKLYAPPTFSSTLKSHLKKGAFMAVKGYIDSYPESDSLRLTAQKVTFLASGKDVVTNENN